MVEPHATNGVNLADLYRSEAPWLDKSPYRLDELERAAALIKASEDARWACIHKCTRAVIRYKALAPCLAFEKKTDARDDIANIQAIADKLVLAIKTMSVSAGAALYENARQHGDKESEPHELLVCALRDYLEWQEGAIEIADARAGRGRGRENDLLRRLDSDMKSAFITATGSDKGFYQFLKSMVEPLARADLISKSLLQDDHTAFRKAWRDSIRIRA